MKVQAKPKTHPGGVHGALLSEMYHSFDAGEPPINKPPIANAPKFKIKSPEKTRILMYMLDFVSIVFYKSKFSEVLAYAITAFLTDSDKDL